MSNKKEMIKEILKTNKEIIWMLLKIDSFTFENFSETELKELWDTMDEIKETLID